MLDQHWIFQIWEIPKSKNCMGFPREDNLYDLMNELKALGKKLVDYDCY